MIYLHGLAALTPGLRQASAFTIGPIALGLAVQFGPADTPLRIARRLTTVPELTLAAATGLIGIAIAAMGPDGVAPFIYFQF